MREVIRAVTLLGMEELVAEFGGDFPALAIEAGIDVEALGNPQNFLPARQVHQLVNLAAERLKRKDFGLMWGARSDPARLGPLHVALMNARTGREAIQLVARFMQINFPMGSVLLEARPGRRQVFIGVRTFLRAPPPLIQFYERRVGSLHVILKHVCGRGYRPEEVWFSHDQQSPLRAYERVFGVKPSFNMQENGVVISQAVLDAVRPDANEQVREMAVSFLRTQGPPANDSLSAETYHMTSMLLRTSNCAAPDVARALGLHVRALQRKLREEGASFEEIKDNVLRAMAETLLAEPKVPLTHAALSLHYANMSAFTRSCRRWFGMPPKLVRRCLANAPGRGVRATPAVQ